MLGAALWFVRWGWDTYCFYLDGLKCRFSGALTEVVWPAESVSGLDRDGLFGDEVSSYWPGVFVLTKSDKG